LEDLGLFAEGPADQGAAGFGVVVEDLVGDGDDAGAFGEHAAEVDAVGVAEGADIGGDEIGALRAVDAEAELFEAVAEQVAAGLQVGAQGVVVVVA
jgi:hypothetical protein